MSFATLTPVTSSCSSSTLSDSNSNMKNERKLQNIDHFNSLLEELEFGSSSPTEPQFLDIEEVPDTFDEDLGEEEEEEIEIKYPYERKDIYENLQERIEQRLNDSGDQELEKRAKEINFLLQAKQAEWKAEEQLERQQSRLKIHHDGSVFTCVMCSKAFPDAEQLQKHTDQAHDLSGVRFKCTLCGKGYKHRKNLYSHMRLHSEDFKCTKCSLVFQSAATLQAHDSRFHQEKVIEDDHKCKTCKQYFPESALKRHIYYCQNKERILERKKALKAQSVPTSPALSTISCASFSSLQPGPSTFRSPLASPVVSYRDKSCQVCGETFASRQSMLRHVGRKHPEVKDDPNVTAIRYVSTESPTHQYTCVECGKRLTTRAALTTHCLRAHSTDQQRHECKICHKQYTVPSELKKHIQRVHGAPKPSAGSLEALPEIPDDIF
uniref:Cation_ATPase_C domain-containing protein n=1 Tax=Caenorhabditis tropicalis TaxID=1561998 RepID=A0A1I7UZH8_9PELO